MGINWPWAAYLTIFHSIYSVLVPIMITHSLFPNIKGERLTSNNGLKLLILLALVNALIFNLLPETYKPPEQYHIFSLILIALFIIAADKLGRLDVRLAKLCSSKNIIIIPGNPSNNPILRYVENTLPITPYNTRNIVIHVFY